LYSILNLKNSKFFIFDVCDYSAEKTFIFILFIWNFFKMNWTFLCSSKLSTDSTWLLLDENYSNSQKPCFAKRVTYIIILKHFFEYNRRERLFFCIIDFSLLPKWKTSILTWARYHFPRIIPSEQPRKEKWNIKIPS
jgi:hypothetical protein